jgi:hypothetical protein
MEIGEGGGLLRWGGKGLKNGPLKALVLLLLFLSEADPLILLFIYIYKKKKSVQRSFNFNGALFIIIII